MQPVFESAVTRPSSPIISEIRCSSRCSGGLFSDALLLFIFKTGLAQSFWLRNRLHQTIEEVIILGNFIRYSTLEYKYQSCSTEQTLVSTGF